MTDSTERFARALAIFDARNDKDPRRDVADGIEVGRTLAEARRLSAWVEKLDPNASEALRLAARCQHLERWTLPRSAFPEGRIGYRRWRRHAAEYHAREAESVLREVGYDEATLAEVRRINLKERLKTTPDVQTMEDSLCLAFIERELDAFAKKHDEEKMLRILRETWKKMSERGRALALGLVDELAPETRELVRRAILD
jgi:hypothetical protein